MVVGLSAVAVFAAAAIRFSRAPNVLPVLPRSPLVEASTRPFFFNGTVRAVYRHSIVPGGVYSAEEVQAAMLRDPLVAAHYAKLDTSRVVGAVLEQPRAVYVSYRIGSRTFWTASKVVLPAGERLLTDGTRVVRARCGNLVSETGGERGVADASGERLDLAELDQPVPALAPDPGAPVVLAAANPDPGPFFQPVAGALSFALGGDPASEVPEDLGTPFTTTTGVIRPPTMTTTGFIAPPTTTTTTGTVPATTTTTGVIVPPSTTTGMGEPTTTTGGFAPPPPPLTTTTETVPTTTTTEMIVPHTVTTTSTPTSGTVPEPSQLALLVLAWVAFRYRPRN